MLFLSELNEQAEKVCKELIEAKRAAKAEKGAKAAYHKGRAEELDKWLSSLESMITKVMERNEADKLRRQAVLKKLYTEREGGNNGSIE